MIDIDLDEDPPTVLYAEARDDAPARRRLHFTLTGTETETFRLRAHTARCDCEWRARVQMVVNPQRTELLVDEDGEPFRTSASHQAKHVTWNGQRWTSIAKGTGA